MNRVKDKVCIVTGGAKGIGQSACQLLAREGSKVAITDIIGFFWLSGKLQLGFFVLNLACGMVLVRIYGKDCHQML